MLNRDLKIVKKEQIDRKKNLGKFSKSIRNLIHETSYKSTSTISRLLKTNLTQHAIKKRLSHRGRKNLLSVDQQELICGLILVLRENGYCVTGKFSIPFIQHNMSIKVYPSWVSLFLKKNGFSMQKITQRIPSQLSDNYLHNCIQFLIQLRTLNKLPQQIWCMDEKGLWSNDGPLKTRAKKKRYSR